MKKIMSILLTGLLSLSLFACADEEKTPNEQPVSKPPLVMIDTLIQDADGEHKCLWKDGYVYFNDHGSTGQQRQKSAVLSLHTEYDMWFFDMDRDLDFVNHFYPVEFEYDETKIEIKENPDKENHFILKVLQPCDKEEIVAKLTARSRFDGMVNENGEPYHKPFTQNIAITISTEA